MEKIIAMLRHCFIITNNHKKSHPDGHQDGKHFWLFNNQSSHDCYCLNSKTHPNYAIKITVENY